MLYTLTRAGQQRDRILLFPSFDTARAVAGDEQAVVRVAVHFDERCRRIAPLWTNPQAFDPTWMTPAESHADGTITAKGPIPEPLFVEGPAPAPEGEPTEPDFGK